MSNLEGMGIALNATARMATSVVESGEVWD